MVNYIAVGVAAVAVFVLGWLWYGPLFGKIWMKLSGIDEKKAKKSMKEGDMGWRMGLNFAGNLVLAFVLAYFIELIGVADIIGRLQVAFWAWLGFVATITLSGVLWENKSWSLWALNNAYNLLGLLIMGAIVGAW